MPIIRLRRGAILVEDPPRRLKEGLRFFSHEAGEYKDLYFTASAGNVLSTMPGFAGRVKALCPDATVRDERRPMPQAKIEDALSGVDPVWREAISSAINAGGGILAVPDILGAADVAAAIARAYPREELACRGTPLTFVATRDRESAKFTRHLMERMLPGREVGSYAASEDVVVEGFVRVPPKSDLR